MEHAKPSGFLATWNIREKPQAKVRPGILTILRGASSELWDFFSHVLCLAVLALQVHMVNIPFPSQQLSYVSIYAKFS